MNEIVSLGSDPRTGRDLFMLDVSAPSRIPDAISLSSQHFICFIACDGLIWSIDDIGEAAARLARSGAVYFCIWGPDCERVHDVVDEVLVGARGDIGNDEVVPTTWHDEEELREALGFAARVAKPATAYEKTCSSILAISVAHGHWPQAILALLSNPQHLDEIGLR
jgi:hypothetical protein